MTRWLVVARWCDAGSLLSLTPQFVPDSSQRYCGRLPNEPGTINMLLAQEDCGSRTVLMYGALVPFTMSGQLTFSIKMRNTVWIFVRVLACAPVNESKISATAKGNRKKRDSFCTST